MLVSYLSPLKFRLTLIFAPEWRKIEGREMQTMLGWRKLEADENLVLGLPQHHQPDQILPNRHWHIAPPSHFGFYTFGLRVVLQYNFFHF